MFHPLLHLVAESTHNNNIHLIQKIDHLVGNISCHDLIFFVSQATLLVRDEGSPESLESSRHGARLNKKEGNDDQATVR
jgi:hypothetical protein